MRHSPPAAALAAALSVAAPAGPALAADAAGAAIARNCYTCHGTDGSGISGMPALQNLTAEQIAAAMTDFSSGRRSATIMNRIAKGYSQDEIRLVAEHLAQHK